MLEHVIASYGAIAVLVGTFLEGETILVLAGFAAHRGYMSLASVILAALVGTVAGDQLYFFIGRRYGRGFLERRPSWTARANRVHGVIERHSTLFMLGFRFWYGMRLVSPFVLGSSRVSAAKFAVLNVIGACLWAVAFAGAGYLFGKTVEHVVDDVKRIELAIFAVLAGAGISLWVVHAWHRRRQIRRTPRNP